MTPARLSPWFAKKLKELGTAINAIKAIPGTSSLTQTSGCKASLEAGAALFSNPLKRNPLKHTAAQLRKGVDPQTLDRSLRSNSMSAAASAAQVIIDGKCSLASSRSSVSRGSSFWCWSFPWHPEKRPFSTCSATGMRVTHPNGHHGQGFERHYSGMHYPSPQQCVGQGSQPHLLKGAVRNVQAF